MKIKVWNNGFDWQGKVDVKGEPVYKAPPTAKSGSLVFPIPPLGEFVEVDLSPPNAGQLPADKVAHIEEVNRKRLNRAIEFTKTVDYPQGKITLVEPGTTPLDQEKTRTEALAEQNKSLQDERDQLAAQLQELSARMAALEAENEPSVEEEESSEEVEEPSVEEEEEASPVKGRRSTKKEND